MKYINVHVMFCTEEYTCTCYGYLIVNITMAVFQRSLVTEAVTKDSDGTVTAAVDHYTQAIEYFLPAIECKLHVHSGRKCSACTVKIN